MTRCHNIAAVCVTKRGLHHYPMTKLGSCHVELSHENRLLRRGDAGGECTRTPSVSSFTPNTYLNKRLPELATSSVQQLTSQRLDEDLHASAKTQNQVKGRLLLDVVVGERASVLQLLPSEDETLLIRGNAFLVLDLGLDVLDGIGRLNLEGDGLAWEREQHVITR